MDFTPAIFKQRISESLAGPRQGDGTVVKPGNPADEPIDLSSLWRISDNEQFLEQSYALIFGRKPDISGHVHNLALLRNHVSRQKIVTQLVTSEEAKQRRRHFIGLHPPESLRPRSTHSLRSFRSAWRIFVDKVADLARVLFHARLDVIEHKLDYVLQELVSRSDKISLKSDQALWSVSEKLDASLVHLNGLDAAGRERLEILADRSERHAEIGARALATGLASTSVNLESSIAKIAEEQTQVIRALVQRSEAAWSELRRLVEEVGARQRGLESLIGEQGKKLEQAVLTIGETLRADSAEWRQAHSSLEQAALTIGQTLRADSAEWRQAHSSLEQALGSEIAVVRDRLRPPVFRGGDNVLVTEVDGFIVGVPGEEWRLAAFLAFRGTFEPGLTRRFKNLLRPDMVVVDVGAHVGLYTLCAARELGPSGKIYSFEPTPRTFDILRHNIQVNGFLESGVITLRQAAVLDRNTTADLRVYADNSGHNTLFHDGSGAFASVPTVSLDAEIGSARVDLVKIDAEGAEPFILRGMKQIMAANPDICIFIEFAPSHLERAGLSPRAFYDELESTGFDISRVDDLDGSLRGASCSELVSCHSANLQLTRRDAAPAGEL